MIYSSCSCNLFSLSKKLSLVGLEQESSIFYDLFNFWLTIAWTHTDRIVSREAYSVLFYQWFICEKRYMLNNMQIKGTTQMHPVLKELVFITFSLVLSQRHLLLQPISALFLSEDPPDPFLCFLSWSHILIKKLLIFLLAEYCVHLCGGTYFIHYY